MLVIFDPSEFQQLEVFLFKVLMLVILFLIQNISFDALNVRRTHCHAEVSRLPSERFLSETLCAQSEEPLFTSRMT